MILNNAQTYLGVEQDLWLKTNTVVMTKYKVIIQDKTPGTDS